MKHYDSSHGNVAAFPKHEGSEQDDEDGNEEENGEHDTEEEDDGENEDDEKNSRRRIGQHHIVDVMVPTP